jgi:KUP system potassium uptake protein
LSSTHTHRPRRFDEAGHKNAVELQADREAPVREARRPTGKQSLNMAAHKLAYRPTPGSRDDDTISARTRFAALQDADRDVVPHAARMVLVLGALGVVYGDIGTSPLYTEQAIFSSYHATQHVTPATVYGVASLIFWALMVIVSIKYAGFIMRAHNRGDGGIMALTALLQRRKAVRWTALLTLGIFGASLFFGDGIVTPAISVLGALQGVQVATPALAHLVVPLSVGILLALFIVQRFGSGTIGWLFGPIMLVWFSVIGLLGLSQIVKDPAVVQGLSPTWGVRFIADHGAAGYLVLGGVVLAVTGAEALYADRGHFGAGPIRIGWFLLAFPALTLNYLGQGAFILHHASLGRNANTFNPFYQMAPTWALWPLVVLAAVATVIASQAVISGSFSVAKQAFQLGFLPRLRMRHTSRMEGQIYVPLINWALCIGVITLTLVFRSSNKLGDMYGVAVTGTFILNTILFLAVARLLWHTSRWKLAIVGVLFLSVEVTFFSANIAKIGHGAWLPLVVGLVISIVMLNWRRGQTIVTKNRVDQEGTLTSFLEELATTACPPARVPGVAVFLCRNDDTTPLSLRAAVKHTHALAQKVVIVSVETVSIPHVDSFDRFTVEIQGRGLFKVFHVTVRCGYRDGLNLPAALQLCRKRGLLERSLDLEHASYFVSRITIVPTGSPSMQPWRKKLFIAMARNASSPIEHFNLPGEQTLMLGSQVPL